MCERPRATRRGTAELTACVLAESCRRTARVPARSGAAGTREGASASRRPGGRPSFPASALGHPAAARLVTASEAPACEDRHDARGSDPRTEHEDDRISDRPGPEGRDRAGGNSDGICIAGFWRLKRNRCRTLWSHGSDGPAAEDAPSSRAQPAGRHAQSHGDMQRRVPGDQLRTNPAMSGRVARRFAAPFGRSALRGMVMLSGDGPKNRGRPESVPG